jgi:hypothetical protein
MSYLTCTGPILLGCNSESQSGKDWKDLPPHIDEEQVAKDVDRSFVSYPEGKTCRLSARFRLAYCCSEVPFRILTIDGLFLVCWIC